MHKHIGRLPRCAYTVLCYNTPEGEDRQGKQMAALLMTTNVLAFKKPIWMVELHSTYAFVLIEILSSEYVSTNSMSS